MRPWVILLVLLPLGACGQWHDGASGLSGPGDADVLAPVIAAYVARHASTGTAICVPQADGLSLRIEEDLIRDGLVIAKDGQRLGYTVGPLDEGMALRVAFRDGTGARFFTRDPEGRLHVGGPMMEARP